MNRTQSTYYIYNLRNSSNLSNILWQLGSPVMNRQSGDSTMVSSSIALLQERFRQLEREREKREEKELLKLFSDSDQAASPAMRFDSNRSFQPEMILPHPQSHRSAPPDYSLSLGHNSQGKHADFGATTSPNLTRLLPNNAAASPSTSRNFDQSDVDTSLHL